MRSNLMRLRSLVFWLRPHEDSTSKQPDAIGAHLVRGFPDLLAGHDHDGDVPPMAPLLLGGLLGHRHAIRSDSQNVLLVHRDKHAVMLLNLGSGQGPLKIVGHALLDVT
jgi:hypothetical protein